MKVGVIGSGIVAKTLSSGLVKHGHDVTIGTRDTSKLEDWARENPKVRVGTFADAARFGDTVIVAVKGSVVADALKLAGASHLDGKTVIDTNNPIADTPPENGVLSFFTAQNGSLMEDLQKQFPNARFVKAFNSVGAAKMVDPDFTGTRPTMFICGNNDDAKGKVTELLDQLGWDSEDMGGAEAARAIEPLCMLWCIPGFRRNEWTHAFKLLK